MLGGPHNYLSGARQSRVFAGHRQKKVDGKLEGRPRLRDHKLIVDGKSRGIEGGRVMKAKESYAEPKNILESIVCQNNHLKLVNCYSETYISGFELQCGNRVSVELQGFREIAVFQGNSSVSGKQ